EAYNRWSRGIIEAKNHVTISELHNLEKAETDTRLLGKKVVFEKKQASWMSKDKQHKIEQVVDAFTKTKLERLHFTSPSVIGVLDTTNSHDPTFIQLFVKTYKNETWEFCHDVPFVVPEALQGHVSKQDESYASAERIHKENNRNGRIPDFRLRIVIPKRKVEIMVGESCRNGADDNKVTGDREKMIRMMKDAEERLERELVNYKITDINHEVREQFSDIDLFAIQSI
ncbi:2119_t:CDS:2, partial [Racocetra fulgida]